MWGSPVLVPETIGLQMLHSAIELTELDEKMGSNYINKVQKGVFLAILLIFTGTGHCGVFAGFPCTMYGKVL